MDCNAGRAEWFNTSLIVRKILAHFSNREILSFSTVNKIWNYEAKSLLKLRGRTGARIGTITLTALVRSIDSISDELRDTAKRSEATIPQDARAQLVAPLRNIAENACEDVANFARLIESMGVIPFRTLNFHIRDNHPGPCMPFDEPAIRSIIENVPVTSLSLSVFRSMEGTDGNNCNATNALHLILKANCHQMRELFVHATTELTLDRHALLSQCSFNHLKVILFNFCNVHSRPTDSELRFLKTAVAIAPNLQYLELQQSLEGHPRDFENETSYLLVENVFRVVLVGSRATLVLRQDPLEAWRLTQDRLNRVAVRYLDVLPTSAEISELNARTTLLRTSWWMLSEVDFDVLALATALRYKITFPNMKRIDLALNIVDLHDYFGFSAAIFASEYWRDCFPNLVTLMIYRTEECYHPQLLRQLWNEWTTELIRASDEMWLKEDDDDWEDEEDWPGSVRELILKGPYLAFDDPPLTFLSQFCPNVTHFAVHFLEDLPEFWTELRYIQQMELNIELNTDGQSNRLESILCGIYPEEVQELLGRDAEFLKRVNIVPAERPITSLEYLTSLEVHFRLQAGMLSGGEANFGSKFVKVSAGLCFSRMPHLRAIFVTFEIPKIHGETEVEHEVFENILKDFPQLNLSVQIVYADATDDDEQDDWEIKSATQIL